MVRNRPNRAYEIAHIAMFFLLVSAACTDMPSVSSDRSTPGILYTDSVEFADIPQVVIGQDLAGAAQFGKIGDIVVRDDIVIVADLFANSLTYHRLSNGDLIRTVGGSGSGPGEFRQLGRIFAGENEELIAFDRGGRRIVIFDSIGSFIGDVKLVPTPGSAGLLPLGTWGNNRILAIVSRNPDMSSLAAGKVYRDTSQIVTVAYRGRDGRLLNEAQIGQELTAIPAADNYVRKDFPATVRMPFGHRISVATAPQLLVYGLGDRPAMIVHRNTMSPVEYWIDVEAKVVNSSDVTSFVAFLIDRSSRDERGRRAATSEVTAFWNKLLTEIPLPTTTPHHGPIILDSFQRVWIPEYKSEHDTSSTAWSIYSIDGERLFSASSPPRFTLLAVEGHVAIGILLDDYDTETLAVYRLQ